MKIEVESEKIVKAVEEIYGIRVIVNTEEDAREALDLILGNEKVFGDHAPLLRRFSMESDRRYKTSAVNYITVFILDFHFEEEIPAGKRVEAVKGLQRFFEQV
ncbi:MAG: hypothetical protein R6U13_00510 [Desulfatiglandaceae bacterium]